MPWCPDCLREFNQEEFNDHLFLWHTDPPDDAHECMVCGIPEPWHISSEHPPGTVVNYHTAYHPVYDHRKGIFVGVVRNFKTYTLAPAQPKSPGCAAGPSTGPCDTSRQEPCSRPSTPTDEPAAPEQEWHLHPDSPPERTPPSQ
jgi:hypothetical protein